MAGGRVGVLDHVDDQNLVDREPMPVPDVGSAAGPQPSHPGPTHRRREDG